MRRSTSPLIASALLALASAAGAQSGAARGEALMGPVARFLERCVTRGEVGNFDRLFDVDRLLDRALRGIEMDAAERQSFSRGVRDGLSPGARLVRATRSGTYTFLRLVRRGAETRAVYRVVGRQGTLDYHELVLEVVDGMPVAVDYFTYTSGELHSATIRRLLQVNHGPAARLGSLGRLQRAFQEGEYERVLELFAAMPQDLQRDKSHLLLRIQAGARLSRAEHLAALQAYGEHVPADDPSRLLMLLDLHMMRGDFRSALAAVASITERVGGDPFLLALRARLQLEDDQLEAAERSATAAVAAAPDLAQGYVVLVAVSLRQATHRRTRQVLEDLDARFTVQMTALRKLAGFDRFLASAPGREWAEEFDALHMRASPGR